MNVQTTYENLVKVLLLGDTSVGKTNLLFRFIENDFIESHLSTIGFDFKSQVVTLEDNTSIKLQIWDTAGQERFMAITRNLFLRAQGILLVYDITEINSFNHIKTWIESIRNVSEVMPIVLLGNKSDMEEKRKVTHEEGQRLAQEYNLQFLETSAKENSNVREAFITITKEILKSYKDNTEKNLNLKKKNRVNNESSGCC